MAVIVSLTCRASDQSPAVDATDSDSQWGSVTDLLDEKFKSNWKSFALDETNGDLAVWKRIPRQDRRDTELHCSGAPRGYLHTTQKFGDFELCFEWRFESDPNGNSGILVFTQDDPRLWPTSIQVQLHQPEAGSVFPVGEAVTDATVRKEGLARPVGEWNRCRIVSLDGGVVVHINGEKAGEVTGCTPGSGMIALQSSGSEVHFRRMQVRVPADSADDTTKSETNEAAADGSDADSERAAG